MASTQPQHRDHGSSGEPPAQGSLQISDPLAVLRMTAMVNRVRAELGEVDLDDRGAARVIALHDGVSTELSHLVSDELRDELDRFTDPGADRAETPGTARVALGQLAGWLEGLLAGVQASTIAAVQRQRPTPGSNGGLDGPEPVGPTPTGLYL